jgi:hypothetical protein
MTTVIKINAGDLRLGTNKGLTVLSGGLLALLVGTGLELDTSGVRLAAPGNGLTGGSGTAYSVQAEDATISVGSSGIKVNKLLSSYAQISNIAPGSSASFTDVNTAVVSAVTTATPQTSLSAAGVFVDASGAYGSSPTFPPPAQILRYGTRGMATIRNHATGNVIIDAGGNEVYAVMYRNTSNSKFYLTYWSDISGTQTSYSFGASPGVIDVLFVDTESFLNLPTTALLGVPGGFADLVTGDITSVTAGDGLSGGGSSGAVSLAVNLDTNPGLEINAGALRAKANNAKGIVRESAGIGVGLASAGSNTGGLEFDGSGNIQMKIAANQGLILGGSGLGVVLNTSAGGNLSKGSSGLRVAAGGAGMPVKAEKDDFTSASFSYSGGLSTIATTVTADSHASIIGQRSLTKSGADVMTMVSGSPAAAGEWRINAGNLEIYGDVTGDGDTYRLRYHSSV